MNWHGRQECQKISIHAPAEGATVDAFVANAEVQYFNPRSRGGSDEDRVTPATFNRISIHAPAEGATLNNRDNDVKDGFQSTLPRRERLHVKLVIIIYI